MTGDRGATEGSRVPMLSRGAMVETHGAMARREATGRRGVTGSRAAMARGGMRRVDTVRGAMASREAMASGGSTENAQFWANMPCCRAFGLITHPVVLVLVCIVQVAQQAMQWPNGLSCE